VTTRNLGAAYPFIAEAGVGQWSVVIGDGLLGGSFAFEPFRALCGRRRLQAEHGRFVIRQIALGHTKTDETP
jgi:hypothetical protein